MTEIGLFVLGLIIGGIIVWLIMFSRTKNIEAAKETFKALSLDALDENSKRINKIIKTPTAKRIFL